MIAPIYQSDLCTIYQGECLEILPNLDPADLLVTDPPYGISFRSNSGKNHSAIEGDGDTQTATAAIRLLRMRGGRHAYVFWSPKVLPPDAGALGFQDWTPLVWDKCIQGMGGPHCWASMYELVLFAAAIQSKVARARGSGKGAARLRRGNVLRCTRKNGTANRRHPTEKPVALLRELVEASSKPGEVVLDPFAGVGSTLVAAILEGRKAIGIEIDPKYAAIAVERVREAEALARQMAKL